MNGLALTILVSQLPKLFGFSVDGDGLISEAAGFVGMARLWRRRRIEFALALTAFRGVALLGVLPGIGVAVALSVLNVFRRLWWPYMAVLGRASGVSGYHDISQYPDAERLPGLVLFRFDAP